MVLLLGKGAIDALDALEIVVATSIATTALGLAKTLK